MSYAEVAPNIPIIDIGPISDSHVVASELESTAQEIGRACRDIGFLFVQNHGVPDAHRKLIFDQIRRFFDLPTEQKMKVFIERSNHFQGYVPLGWEETDGLKDWHEAFDFRPKLPTAGSAGFDWRAALESCEWPEHPSGFKEVMLAHWGQMMTLGERIARGIALSLGVDDGFLARFTTNAFCTMRVLHYPIQDGVDPGVGEGIGPHIDYGFLTILDQEGESGLEVMTAQGDWVPVPRIPGTYVVNIGRVVQIWTNDAYPATRHRVRGVQGDRYSLPFFYNPSFDAIIEPLPVCCSPDNPAKYEPYCHGEFMAGRLRKAFGGDPSLRGSQAYR